MRKIGNSDFSTKPTNFYNLDVIISVGYRVKSLQGTQFRWWANQVLKDYMLKGYAVNQRKIATDLQIADRIQRSGLYYSRGGHRENSGEHEGKITHFPYFPVTLSVYSGV